MLLLLMLTSKGMAGVPRASLVVIAATLASFDILEAGLLLIIMASIVSRYGALGTNDRQHARYRRGRKVGGREVHHPVPEPALAPAPA
jgi:hypothetical protein